MLEQARYRLRYNKEHVEFTGFFSEKLPFNDHSFTQIICLNSFHYYVDQQTVMAHFRRLLKPGGTLWIQDWNRAGTFILASKMIDLFSPENINTRNLEEMKQMCRQYGFIVKGEDAWGYRWWKFFFLKCKLKYNLTNF